MTNPLDEYFALKEAGVADTVKSIGKHVGGTAGKALLGGAGAAVGAGAVGAGGMAASKLWDAVTKAQDFRQMMESSFNGDLHELHATQPKQFNEAFSSLRRFAPQFTKDPMVAGTYMRRMMTMRPDSAGGALVEALDRAKALPESRAGAMFERAGITGASHGAQESMRARSAEDLAHFKAEHEANMETMRKDTAQANMLRTYLQRGGGPFTGGPTSQSE